MDSRKSRLPALDPRELSFRASFKSTCDASIAGAGPKITLAAIDKSNENAITRPLIAG